MNAHNLLEISKLLEKQVNNASHLEFSKHLRFTCGANVAPQVVRRLEGR